jgi:hypothetical protein
MRSALKVTVLLPIFLFDIHVYTQLWPSGKNYVALLWVGDVHSSYMWRVKINSTAISWEPKLSF